jgi:hypothetical protein
MSTEEIPAEESAHPVKPKEPFPLELAPAGVSKEPKGGAGRPTAVAVKLAVWPPVRLVKVRLDGLNVYPDKEGVMVMLLPIATDKL